DFKEYTDAEGVIALPTSDFHKPICLEMRLAAANRQASQFGLLAGSPLGGAYQRHQATTFTSPVSSRAGGEEAAPPEDREPEAEAEGEGEAEANDEQRALLQRRDGPDASGGDAHGRGEPT
ncbi:GL20770, partial [Drosophila persimilis]